MTARAALGAILVRIIDGYLQSHRVNVSVKYRSVERGNIPGNACIDSQSSSLPMIDYSVGSIYNCIRSDKASRRSGTNRAPIGNHFEQTLLGIKIPGKKGMQKCKEERNHWKDDMDCGNSGDLYTRRLSFTEGPKN